MDLGLCKLIDNSKVVSFDIFDTLVRRCFHRPRDVFNYIESKYNAEGFGKARVNAERRSRLNRINNQDVTLDQIYNFIDDKYKYLKKIEINTELDCCRPSPVLKEIFDYAIKSKKKVVITSDMYLPIDVIYKMLIKCKYKVSKSDIYLSNDRRVTKTTGDLFKLILSERKIPAIELLHIGDNDLADIKVPSSLGIVTYKVNKLTDKYLEKNKNILCNDSLGISRWIDLIAENDEKEHKDYWYRIGYNIAGISVWFMNSYIANAVKRDKLKNILFVARDGYLLNKTYNLFDKKTRKIYFYGTRSICANAKNMKEYFDSFNIKGNIGAFDIVTGSHSLYNVLSKCLSDKQKLVSYYFNILKEDKSAIEYSLQGSTGPHKLRYWDFFEYIISAPELPIITLDDKFNPVYKELDKDSQWELEKIENVKRIEAGVVDFCKDMKNTPLDIEITNEDVINIINHFTSHMSGEDINNLSGIKCTRNSTYDVTRSVFTKGLNIVPKTQKDYWGKLKYLQSISTGIISSNQINILFSRNVDNLNKLYPNKNIVQWSDRNSCRIDLVVLWGVTPQPDIVRAVDFAYDRDLPIIVVENGFIRSAEAWHRNNQSKTIYNYGWSFISDVYPYFDAYNTNKIEEDLNTYNVTRSEMKRARKCIDYIVENYLTKYNHQPIKDFKPKEWFWDNRFKKNLVIDQAYNDSSITLGMANDNTFNKMLTDAAQQNRECVAIVKTHPESNLGQRTGYYSNLVGSGNVLIYRDNINPIKLIQACDEVFVCSSQFGFESLMCEKPTHIYGVPIYSGWGLTPYERKIYRRNRKRNIEEVFFILYIKNTVWVSPVTGEICKIEDALKEIKDLRDEFMKINLRR